MGTINRRMEFGEWVITPKGEGQFIHYNADNTATIDVAGEWLRIEESEIARIEGLKTVAVITPSTWNFKRYIREVKEGPMKYIHVRSDQDIRGIELAGYVCLHDSRKIKNVDFVIRMTKTRIR